MLDTRLVEQRSQRLAACRISIVLHTLELGGSERQAIMQARCLMEQGANVQLLALGPGQATQLADALNVPWRVIQPLPARGDSTAHLLEASRPTASARLWQAVKHRQPRSVQLLRYAFRLWRELRRDRPDVLLSFTVVPNVLCGLVWRWTSARLFIWNQREVSMSSGWAAGERLAVRLTPQFVSNSRHGAAYLTQVYGVTPGRIWVIPNGVEFQTPREDQSTWRRRLGLSPADFVAGMVANLSHYKDHSTLLEAWRCVLDKAPPDTGAPILLLAGRHDDAYEALCLQASRLALGNHVRFLGPIDDVAGLLQILDVGVYSSRAEGSPNAVLEYMAAGVPVVATDIPGIREVVGEAGQPWLAQAGDALALATLVLEAIHRPVELQELGLRNRARAEGLYSMSQMCAALTELVAARAT